MAEALERNRTLTSLNLRCECRSFLRLKKALLCGLILFCCCCLIDNSIGVEGAKRLAEALKCNNTLINLNLGSECHVFVRWKKSVAIYVDYYCCCCCLIDNSIVDEGAKRLAEALERNSTLTMLNLYSKYHALLQLKKVPLC